MVDQDSILHTLKWSLVEYGLQHDDPILNTRDDGMLSRLRSQYRAEFEQQEQLWAQWNVSSTERKVLHTERVRFSMGLSRKESDPLVSRPFDYGTFLTYRDLDTEMRRKLFYRGLEVAKSPVDTHYLLLSALRESRIGFERDEYDRLIALFGENRPRADELMILEYGNLPPDVGDELLEESDEDYP